MFSWPLDLWKGGTWALERDSFFFHFIDMKDDKHTTFQLLTTKGDAKVVITRLVASIEYGEHNALSSYLGVL